MAYSFPSIDFEQITSNGYFPAELPPFYSTSSLASFYAIRSNRTRVMAFTSSITTSSTNFSFPKNYKSRRHGEIVNPTSHLKICDILLSQRNFISRQISSSKFSLSKPILFALNLKNAKYIGVSSSRYFEPSFKHSQLGDLRLKHALSFKYMLKLDIGSFYANMYVHSISWAACTKEVAKEVWRSRNNNQDYPIAIQFENAVKSIQDKETRGIPLGHDFAFIVAEMVLSGLDRVIENNMPKDHSYIILRHVDDYEIYFNDYNQAIHSQEIIRAIFEDYGFHLNEEKQKLLSFPFDVQEEWIDDLSSIEIPSQNTEYKRFLSSLIRKANRYFSEDKNDRAVKYILQILRPYKDKAGLNNIENVAASNWHDFEMTLAYMAKLDFRNINIIYDIVKYFKVTKPSLEISNICEVILNELSVIRPDYCYEIGWISWLIDEFWNDFKKTKNLEDILLKFTNNILQSGTPIAILSCLRMLDQHQLLKQHEADFSKVLRKRLNIDLRKSIINQQKHISSLLLTSDWLLVYTLCEKNWCSFNDQWLEDGYHVLKSSGVTFLTGTTTLKSKALEMGISIAGMGGFASISYVD